MKSRTFYLIFCGILGIAVASMAANLELDDSKAASAAVEKIPAAKAGDILRVGEDDYQFITHHYVSKKADNQIIYRLVLPPELKKQIDDWAKGPRTSNVELDGTIELWPGVNIFRATAILDNARRVDGKRTAERRRAGLHDLVVEGDLVAPKDIFELLDLGQLGQPINPNNVDMETILTVLEKGKGVTLLAFETTFHNREKRWTCRLTFQSDMARKEFEKWIRKNLKRTAAITDTDEEDLDKDWLGQKKPR